MFKFKRKRSIGKKQKNGDIQFNIKIKDIDEIKLPYTMNGNVSYLNEFYDDLTSLVSGESTTTNFNININTTTKTTPANETEFNNSYVEYFKLKRIQIHNDIRSNALVCLILGFCAIAIFSLLASIEFFLKASAPSVFLDIVWDFFMVFAWVISWEFFSRVTFKYFILKKSLLRNKQMIEAKIVFTRAIEIKK